MRLFGVAFGVLLFVRPPALGAQTASLAGYVGTWLKVEADSEKQYWNPSTGGMTTKKEAPNHNVDRLIPVDAVLVLRADSTWDFFGMAGEKNVWGSAKGVAFRMKDAKTMRFVGPNERADFQLVLTGNQLSITRKPDAGYGPPELWGVFQKYADTTAPYAVLQRR